jgi:hypothetical protein
MGLALPGTTHHLSDEPLWEFRLLGEVTPAKPPRENHESRVGLVQAGEDPQQTGLTHSVSAHHADSFTARNREGGVAQQWTIGTAKLDVLKIEKGGHGQARLVRSVTRHHRDIRNVTK